MTLLPPNDCVAFGCTAVVLVLEMLTKAGVGIMFVDFDMFAVRKPLAGAEVNETGWGCAVAIVGTSGGGVVGVAIILPEAVVILLPCVLFIFCCLFVEERF